MTRLDLDDPQLYLSLTLAYRPPLAWDAMLAYLGARAIPGIEVVSADGGGRYWRTVWLYGHSGYVAVRRRQRTDALEVEISADLIPVIVPLLARLRRLFDLDSDPHTVTAHLASDPVLAPLVDRWPGLRVPGTVDGMELALRAVLGQQVSVRGATTLAGRLAAHFAEPLPDGPSIPLTYCPLAAERLADAPIASVMRVGLPRARAECIVALARTVADGGLPELSSDAPCGNPAEFIRRFMAIPGIGAWTAEYVAMRALSWPDAFPEGDLALRKAMGGLTPTRLRAAAERWRPWRAYAAQQLWFGLG